MEMSTEIVEFPISSPIVDIIIGNMFFWPEENFDGFGDDDDSDDNGAADAICKKFAKNAKEKVNAMKLFAQQSDGSYLVTMQNTMHYDLAIDLTSIGMSFRPTSVAIEYAKNRTKTAKLTSINDLIVGQYVRVGVGIALQRIANMLSDESVWVFALAGDSNTHHGKSFSNLRVCFCFRGTLYNFHLVAIPSFDHHTAVTIFNVIVRFLDALYSEWRNRLIVVMCNGTNTMTGRYASVVTRLVQAAMNQVIRV